jgi:glycosyltransferase involved in cell wall biosynthesis
LSRRVCYFTPASGFGGAEQALLTLAGGLDRRRWERVVMHHGLPGLTPLLEGSERIGAELMTVPPMPDGAQGAGRLPAFVRTLRAVKPAVFHAQLTWPFAAKFALAGAILARVPAVVATVHLFPSVRIATTSYLQHRALASRVGRYIAVSRDVARRLTDELAWPASKITVVHNGIELAAFRSRSDGRAAQTPNARPVVLAVARLERQKGLRYLIDAAAHLPEADVLIAGEGSERPALEAQTRSLGCDERVRFLGYRSDVPSLLAACDVFVLPSEWEGLPLVLLEAMAAERPIVASAIPGNAEAVADGETGLLVPPRDAAALAAAIRTILSNQDRARRFALAGRTRVQHEFSAEAMVKATESIYDELLG